MENIKNLIAKYNLNINYIQSYPKWDQCVIPSDLIDENTKIMYQIYNAIITYIIVNKKYNTYPQCIMTDIYNVFFEHQKGISLEYFEIFLNRKLY